jgi:hypothetical protein
MYSIRKLNHFLELNGFQTSRLFATGNYYELIEVITLNTGDMFIISIPSKFRIKKTGGSNEYILSPRSSGYESAIRKNNKVTKKGKKKVTKKDKKKVTKKDKKVTKKDKKVTKKDKKKVTKKDKKVTKKDKKKVTKKDKKKVTKKDKKKVTKKHDEIEDGATTDQYADQSDVDAKESKKTNNHIMIEDELELEFLKEFNIANSEKTNNYNMIEDELELEFLTEFNIGNGENVDDENVDDENVDDENVDDENVDDENVDDENVDDENVDDENVDDENVINTLDLKYHNQDERKYDHADQKSDIDDEMERDLDHLGLSDSDMSDKDNDYLPDIVNDAISSPNKLDVYETISNKTEMPTLTESYYPVDVNSEYNQHKKCSSQISRLSSLVEGLGYGLMIIKGNCLCLYDKKQKQQSFNFKNNLLDEFIVLICIPLDVFMNKQEDVSQDIPFISAGVRKILSQSSIKYQKYIDQNFLYMKSMSKTTDKLHYRKEEFNIYIKKYEQLLYRLNYSGNEKKDAMNEADEKRSLCRNFADDITSNFEIKKLSKEIIEIGITKHNVVAQLIKLKKGLGKILLTLDDSLYLNSIIVDVYRQNRSSIEKLV